MKAGQVLKLAGDNYLRDVAEQHRVSATNVLNTVLAAADTFNDELAVVAANSKLTPEGRAAESAKVAAAALTKLAGVETNIKTLTERAASLEKLLLSKVTYHGPTDPANRLAHELALREIRDQLRQLPLLERTNVYRTSTDPLVLAAIENAQMTLSETRPDGSRRMEPFVDPQQMTAAKLERAAKVDPATANTLSEVRALCEMYSHAVNGVKREVLDEVPDGKFAMEP